VPGKYTVRLTVNGRSQTAPLTVKMDPRVKTSPAGIQLMFSLQMRLSSLLTTTSQAVMQARSISEQLDKISGQASGSTASAIEAFRKKLQALRGSAMPEPNTEERTLRRVNGAASTLYDDVDRADAAPTAAQTEATATAEKDAAEILQRWAEFKKTNLPALNTALHGANLPEMHLEPMPKASADDADEE